MSAKSVKTNALLNMAKTVISLVFPMIIFPYVSRSLQVENLGKVTFIRSFVNFFLLFSTLGLKTYGIREGAALARDREKFQAFFSQVLTITCVSTAISLAALFACGYLFAQLQENYGLLMIFSVSVILPTIGCEWVCGVYEDYGYLSVRSVLVQLISLVLIFIFVRRPDDYYRYGCILVFSSQGINLFSLWHIRKYVKFSFSRTVNLRRHLKPMLILLASSLATTIYVSSDTTILGFLSGDYYTGLYTAASKLYAVVKNLISAMIIVSIPRFSYYYTQGKLEQYQGLLNKLSKALILLAVPAATGVFMLSEDIILALSGQAYLCAVPTLRILSIAIVFVAASWIQSQCILIPMRKEQWVFAVSAATAGLNVLLNFLLVPKWQHNAAAATTVLSEGIVVLLYALLIRGKVQLQDLHKQVVHAVMGSMVMLIWLLYLQTWQISVFLRLPAAIIGGSLIYFSCLMLLRNKIALELVSTVLSRVVRVLKR